MPLWVGRLDGLAGPGYPRPRAASASERNGRGTHAPFGREPRIRLVIVLSGPQGLHLRQRELCGGMLAALGEAGRRSALWRPALRRGGPPAAAPRRIGSWSALAGGHDVGRGRVNVHVCALPIAQLGTQGNGAGRAGAHLTITCNRAPEPSVAPAHAARPFVNSNSRSTAPVGAPRAPASGRASGSAHPAGLVATTPAR